MANYEEGRVQLTNTQLNKFKSAAKKKETGTTLRITKKNFQDEELPHELFLTRLRTKMRNAFANDVFTDIKVSKAELAKIIQSVEFLGKRMGKLGKEILTKFIVLSTGDVLPILVIKATSFLIDKLERKRSAWGALRAGKKFTLFISNKDINDVIRIVKSLEN